MLLSLNELSGQGTKQGVLDHIEHQGYWHFDSADLEILPSRNEIKWRNKLAFVRQDLEKAKHLDGSNRNLWVITSAGQKYFENLALQVLASTALRKVTPNAVAALRKMNVEGTLPEEIRSKQGLREGATCQITVNAYERNLAARNLCLQHYGTVCSVCGIGLGSLYGTIAEGRIHVHHLRPLSEIGEEYEVDPIVDLRPVCPNCHMVIHLANPPYTIEEVKAMLTAND